MLSSERLKRKLAAILYADVAHYSRLTGQDEEGTHRRLSKYLDQFSEYIQNHQGNVVHYAGDAILADFRTVTDALTCAVGIQQALKNENELLPEEHRVQFRIGVNLGEVIVDRDDIYGDGVNIAARLEGLAEVGGICVSQSVRTAVGNKLPIDYQDMGLQRVKNIDEPIHAYHILFDAVGRSGRIRKIRVSRKAVVQSVVTLTLVVVAVTWFAPWNAKDGEAPMEQEATSVGDERTIAVLPFVSLSDDPAQDYFSDGVTNDIITDLSKFSNLFVIASNSVFTYKGKAVNLKEVGRELGVRYVLEGSIQKVADKVRINVQLIDATTNHHLWAERYDFELNNIFSVQDEITNTVVTSLQVMLTKGEQDRSASRLTTVVEAYDFYLRGRTYLRGTKRTHAKARELFNQAIKLDPEFAAAYAEKSFTYFSSFIMPMSNDSEVIDAAVETAERAVALDDTLPLAHARLAWAYFASRQHNKAVKEAHRAVALGPNDAEAHAQLGNVLNWSGIPREGMRYIEKAMRLNPHHPYYYLFYLGHSHYLLNNREEAIALMKRVVTRAPYFLPVRRHLAVLLTEVGLEEEAKKHTEEILRIFPRASIEDERARCYYKWTPPLMERFFDGLRKSGMPEGVAGEEPMSM